MLCTSQVGEQTADDSDDPILKKELPRPLVAVQKAADQLVEAAQTLKDQPTSVPGRRLLIIGARGKGDLVQWSSTAQAATRTPNFGNVMCIASYSVVMVSFTSNILNQANETLKNVAPMFVISLPCSL